MLYIKVTFQVRFSSEKEKEQECWQKKIATQGKIQLSDMHEAVNKEVTRV